MYNLPPIKSSYNYEKTDYSKIKISNIFQTLDYIFNTIVRLFYIRSNHENHTLNLSVPEMNTIYVEIAQAFVHLSLPHLTMEYKIVWFYQKKLRSLLLIFRQIIFFQLSSFTNNFPSNPINSIITIVYNYLTSSSSSSSSTQFLIQLGFDALQSFVILIECIFSNLKQTNSVQRGTTNDLLNIINQFLINDYFPLFNLLSINRQNEHNSKQLLEHCSNVLKCLKIYRSKKLQRKHNRRIIRKFGENNYEQAYILHHHQSSFEIIINNKHHFDGNIEIEDKSNNNEIKRICVISALYDKLLRLTIKQLESSRPLFSFIQVSLMSLL